jgi:heat shock protein HtpX
MEMCVDNPRSGFVDLFATHPPIEQRIKALVTLAGGHDPGPDVQPESQIVSEEG